MPMPSISPLSSYLLPSSNVTLVRIRRLNSSHYFEGETLRKWQPTTWHISGPYGLKITVNYGTTALQEIIKLETQKATDKLQG